MSCAEYNCVAVAEVESFVERCMMAVGTDPQHCKALSQVLIEADVRGHLTHGLHRLGRINHNKCSTMHHNKGYYIVILVWSTRKSSFSTSETSDIM